MIITLPYLKKAWDKKRLATIRKGLFYIGSHKMLLAKNREMAEAVSAVWSDDHDHSIRIRTKNGLKHIFISQICDVAVEEYKTVCQLLKVRAIVLVSDMCDKDFFSRSRKLLKPIGIPIYEFWGSK